MTDPKLHRGERDRSGLSVWALEPYFGGSHKYFLEGLAGHSKHDFTLFTLPGRHWKWRMQGGALSLAGRAADGLSSAGPRPSVLFASDMLDLPVFLAAGDSVFARVPAILYLHENPPPPNAETVARRSLILAALSCRGFVDNEENDPDGAAELARRSFDWLCSLGLDKELKRLGAEGSWH